MLYSSNHMETVGIKGLICVFIFVLGTAISFNKLFMYLLTKEFFDSWCMLELHNCMVT